MKKNINILPENNEEKTNSKINKIKKETEAKVAAILELEKLINENNI